MSPMTNNNDCEREVLKQKIILIVFYVLVLVVLVNTFVMTLYLINANEDYKIFNHAYKEAVLPEQDINETMKTGIVRIKEYEFHDLEVGTKVVMCCDYQIDTPWVETVVNKKQDRQLETTYEGVISTNVSEDNVYGVFVKEANILGTLYYSSSFITGYLYLTASHILLVSLYYILLLRNKKLNLLQLNQEQC